MSNRCVSYRAHDAWQFLMIITNLSLIYKWFQPPRYRNDSMSNPTLLKCIICSSWSGAWIFHACRFSGTKAPCQPDGACLVSPIFATRAGAADGVSAELVPVVGVFILRILFF